MGLNATPSAERIHIGFFGRRNAGKSSIVNAITGQQMSVVSDTKGTTTDPVTKSMELLPLGPVVIIDTPGFDDEGSLGEQRIKRTRQILNRADCAVLVVDGTEGLGTADLELLNLFKEKEIPCLIVFNKCDLPAFQEPQSLDFSATITNLSGNGISGTAISRTAISDTTRSGSNLSNANMLCVSAQKNIGIQELKERIASLIQTGKPARALVRDLLHPGDLVIQVIPIDESAPKGRLILPQQMMIREVLEAGAISIVCRETELEETLTRFQTSEIKPSMVITDSQAFGLVSRLVPNEIPLTSYSILMARYKGFLETAVRGVSAISTLKDGDRILISEGCTHHRQCGDIGTVKIPGWLRACTGKSLEIETSSGLGFPEDLSNFKLVIHCGGCMLNEREVLYRQKSALDAGIPFTNYGITIAFMKGILKRSLRLFPELAKLVP